MIFFKCIFSENIINKSVRDGIALTRIILSDLKTISNEKIINKMVTYYVFFSYMSNENFT